MSEEIDEPIYKAWIIEGVWNGTGHKIYLGTNGYVDRNFFIWTSDIRRALQFACWNSADEVLRIVRDIRPELHMMALDQRIREHEFRGFGGAKETAEYERPTGRTQ